MQKTTFSTVLTTMALAALLSGCVSAPPVKPPLAVAQPEGASGYTVKPGWATSKFAVAAANPLATEAGYNILKAGGSAVDAAVTVQMVLGLVEPQSSGIAGGAFLLHTDGKTTEAYDGRETAPAAVNDKLFLEADGKPMAFNDAVVSGRSVGVPGAVRMLEMAHQQHGKLPWAQLFEPAIALADKGFQVSPRLNTLLKEDQFLKKDATSAAYFYDAAGQPWPVGHLLKNPSYAAVLRTIAKLGAKGLLEGDLAQAMVSKVRQHPNNPGQLSLTDLANYQAKKRTPLCFDYPTARTTYSICGMPPPSSGALAIGQILGILNNTDAAKLAFNAVPSADWLHLYTEASRLAFADRAQYVADPDFVTPPAGNWMSLLEPSYLSQRAQLIGAQSMKVAPAGAPGIVKTSYAAMPDQPEFGTSHISIIDAAGNALAMTTTIEAAFGSRQMVNPTPALAGGFLLNNELTDFSFAAQDADGKPVANRVEAGKRPRSSMSPTLVFDKTTGQVVMSAGSPGGALIIHFTAKTLYAMLNWGLSAQEAINLPNFGSLNGPTLLEENRFPVATVEALKARGHEVRESNMTSGLQAIERTKTTDSPSYNGFFGGADPRREGIVMGD